MGTYMIPRNLKGETRILMIFSVKSLLTTAVGAVVGAGIFLIVGMAMNQRIAGFIIIGVLAAIGFAVGTFKIPTLGGVQFTKKIGGESLDEIIKRYFLFRNKKRTYSYYVAKEGEE